MRGGLGWSMCLALLVVAGGCFGLQLRQDGGGDDEAFTAPTEDGARYVKVEGGMLSTRKALIRRWKSVARRGCDGDYLVLSDATFERRKLGVVRQRIHEGYVRCLLPDEPAAPTDRQRAAR